MARARALFIAPAPPERTGNGLAMRPGIFLEALARVADTEVMILPVAGGGDSALAADLGARIATVPVVTREHRASSRGLRLPSVPTVSSLLSPSSMPSAKCSRGQSSASISST